MQYNVKPPGLQLEITSAQAVSQPCYSNSSGRHYKAEEHMHRQWWCITSTTALFEPEAIHYDFLYDTQELVHMTSFFKQAIRLWNQLPGSVVEADSLDSFTTQLSMAILI